MTDIIEQKKPELITLCRKFRVRQLEVFGSAAQGRFNPASSDLDFLVTFEPSEPADHANCYFGLLAALQDLFGRHIDLIESSAIRNPYFRTSVESSRVSIYAA